MTDGEVLGETAALALTDGDKRNDAAGEAVQLGLIVLVEAVEFFQIAWSVLQVYIVSSTNGELMFSSKRFEL